MSERVAQALNLDHGDDHRDTKTAAVHANASLDVGQIIHLSVSKEEEKRVLRKIDMIMLPLMALVYMLQLLDKFALTLATLLGIIQDTHLVGTQYSWTSSIFYFGYLVWSPPTSWLVTRFPLGPYLAVTIALWGGILMCHAACNNFAGLMCVRFFLGVAEAAVTPGFALLVGMFYTRKEQPIRQNAWAIGNSVASMIAGVIAYSIGHISTAHIPTWKSLFLIFGSITTVYGVLLYFILPPSPATARFLNTREREVAVHRTLANKTGTMDERTYVKSQVLEALRDPQAWLMAGYMFTIMIPNGALSSFQSLIIAGFGFSPFRALLLAMPGGAFQLIFFLYTTIVSYFFRNCRLKLMLSIVLVSLIGSLILYCLGHEHRVGRLIGVYLSAQLAVNIPLLLSLISANVAGFTKKTTVSAMIFVAYCVGNIIGPQFFLSGEAPNYGTGLRAMVSGFSFATAFVILLYVYYRYENARRDRVYGPAEARDEDAEIAEEISNLTDRNIEGFRYAL